MSMSIEKPPHGSPCNQCGMCCKISLCQLASDLVAPRRRQGFEVPGPCPFLEAGTDGRSACGLATHPATYFPVKAKAEGNARLVRATTELIGSGLGCDSILGDEPENIGFNEALLELQSEHRETIRGAQRVWGIPVW